MRYLLLSNPVHMGMGFILLLSGIGCASTSDLEKLNEGLIHQGESLTAVQAQVGDLRAEIQSVQQTVAHVEQLPSRVTGLTTDLQSLRRTLLTNYQLEEAALRERLKILERIRMQLQSETAAQPVDAPLSPVKPPGQGTHESQLGGGQK